MKTQSIESMKAYIKQLQDVLQTAENDRDAALLAAHTFTADDYRICIIQDEPSANSFDDIWGDACQDEIDDPNSKYNDWLDAYNNGRGIYGFAVVLYRRHPSPAVEPELVDSCSGFYSVYDYPEHDTIASMREYMSAELAPGVSIDDVELCDEAEIAAAFSS